MNVTNKTLVKTPCPICSSRQVRMIIDVMPNEDKKRIRFLNNSYVILYNGAKWVCQNSAGVLAWSNGLPYSLGKNAAKLLTNLTDATMENQQAKMRELLNQLPDSLYLIEFVCNDCGFVLNRYYTRNWD